LCGLKTVESKYVKPQDPKPVKGASISLPLSPKPYAVNGELEVNCDFP
jgi:hypothetical protein